MNSHETFVNLMQYSFLIDFLPRGVPPVARYGHTSVKGKKKASSKIIFFCLVYPYLVLYGGATGDQIFNDVHLYDTEKNSW